MNKPTQDELNVARAVIEYCIADTTKNEPYAVNSIAALEGALEVLPYTEDELGDI